MTWPDIVIGAILLIAALRGFKRGLVSEAGGVLAMAAGVWGAVTYRGGLDGPIIDATSANPWVAHVAGALAVGIGAFVFVALLAALVNRIARLPVLGAFNALGGAAMGLLKGLVLVWVLLFAVLFLPIAQSTRAEIKSSLLGSLLLRPNEFVDEQIEKNVPPFAKPYAGPALRAHEGATSAPGATPS